MSGRLNWAMEKMGWRVPEEDGDLSEPEYPFAEVSSFAETHDYVSPPVAQPASTPPAAPAEPVAQSTEIRQRIATIHPKSYSDVMAVGEAFRDNVPVIMNLTGMDDAEARRVVDFAAGLTFGVYGTIERVTTRVFLLSPVDVQVARDRGARYSEGRR